ncbi:hypothetical protein DFH05DRAFT_1395005 [Lentinula detonsa]|uniref:Alpha beta-hydrolase n=2 Tax=Lentinula TaxID=5352 RepID=A0A9W8P4Z0_9AGAR|nr:hypothetical protein DFH05DRAFT_1395005 [Lentinula detonsa]KAJ3783977.1 hypothetical protein GGU10DRAFT_272387 [Lentinula aff. detonsa]KAJ3980321.1 hypothetical protein F5890DRAFT_1419862 [Lentinula detonsa]
MPSLQIQTYSLSEGIELSFTDSGAPPDSVSYTTVFFLHGGIFNAYQFHKVHAHAHALNLRTVLLHRRDYAGSTPYSGTEIEELKEGSVVFWERLSAQLAEFLGIFIKREKIPKLTRRKSPLQDTAHILHTNFANTNGEGNGGVAIFGWSAGCSTVLSLLGAIQNPFIPDDLYKGLQEYVRSCLIYDPTYFSFGYTPPSDSRNYIPWDDPTVSKEDLPQVVAEWVSSYYDHPCYDVVGQSLPSTASIYDLDGIRSKSEQISFSSWTEEDIAKGLEGASANNEVLA